jgi:drug/metabolite transporter (DMT)-like permease
MTANPIATARSSPATGIVLVTVATVVWASGGLFTRLSPFDLWTIVFWRGVFGTVFIGAYVFFRFGCGAPGLIWQAGPAGVVVTLCSAATIILFPAAFQHTSIANAFTFVASLPFVTAAIAWVWLRERPTLAMIAASTIAVLGIVIMVGPATGGAHLGDLLAFLGVLSQAIMTVAVRRRPDIVMLPMAWTAIIVSVLVSCPLAAHLWDLTARDYAVAAGFGLGPMTLGMMLYVMGSALIPSMLATLINTMEAPIGALWAWAGVGEVPPTATIAGGAIVLASVFGLLSWEQRAQRVPAGMRRPIPMPRRSDEQL